MRWLLALGVVSGFLLTAFAEPPSVITPANVRDLHSVVTLDFSEVEALDLTPGSGIFAINEDASVVVTFARAPDESPLSTAVVWDGVTGDIRNTLFVGENQYDRIVHEESLLVATQTGAKRFDLTSGESSDALTVDAGPVLSVWVLPDGVVCGETTPELGKNEVIVCSDDRPNVDLFVGIEGFARIGRVPPPLAVTVTIEGIVRVWNMTTSSIIREADASGMAFFGAVNIDGSPGARGSAAYLAWRDPESTVLNLLDFASGENIPVAALDGTYIAHILLSRSGDVILGIDPMSARREVWAWLPETGEHLRLGQFRECTRQQPDQAKLSYDGTALVIGCDSGIDIWRVD